MKCQLNKYVDTEIIIVENEWQSNLSRVGVSW